MGQFGRDKEFRLAASLHQLKSLGPPFDHAMDREPGGHSPFVGAVKLGAVEQAPPVMHHDLVRRLWGFSRALLDGLHLQATREGLNAFGPGVLFQESLALENCRLSHGAEGQCTAQERG